MKEGDKILLRRKKTTTKSPWDPNPLVAEEIKGYHVKVRQDGEEMTRNVLMWKILKERPESFKGKKIKGRSWGKRRGRR